MPWRRRTSTASPSNATRGSSSMPSRMTENFRSAATPSATSSSRTSGLTATSRSVARASTVSIPRKTSVPSGRSSRGGRDRGTCGRRRAGSEPGEQRRGAPDGAGLRRVGVDDVRPDCADELREPPGRDRVADGRELAREAGKPDDLDAGALGDERHRLLAARDVAGDERRLVAALREAAREVGDVQRGTAHVEARDHPQHADRAGGHRARMYGAAYTRAVLVAKTLFWGSLGALAWTHVGYPLAAGALARVRGAPRRERRRWEPTVT